VQVKIKYNMNKRIISLFCSLCIGLVVGQSLTVYGVSNPSISNGVLKADADDVSIPIILELTNITSSVHRTSSIDYFEGKLFEKPTKAIWFHRDNKKASLRDIHKSAAVINTSDNITLALYIDSRKIWPLNETSLVYNHTVSTANGIYKTLRYQVPYKKNIKVTLPPEIAHLSTVLKKERNVIRANITKYNRTIEGLGAHRKVITTMQISADKDLNNCKLYTLEPVLEHHFVEIDFLDEIAGCKYWINKNCNIELPSAYVPQYLLAFRFDDMETDNEFYSATKKGNEYRVKYKYPYHFRYQSAGNNEYEPVEVLNPLVYLSCNKKYENNDIEGILLKHIFGTSNAISAIHTKIPKIWKGEVPTGLLKDRPIVGTLTILITVSAALVIISIASRKTIAE